MSRKIYRHFMKSKYIDIHKDPPPLVKLPSEWWKKYLERENSYKPKNHRK